MPEYSLEFGKRLAQLANSIVKGGDPETPRAVLYLSLLSAEISLKAMLEQAGIPVKEIKDKSHNHAGLLSDLDRCEIEVEMAPGGTTKIVRALDRLRLKSIKHGEAEITVGEMIKRLVDASQYPNEIRYGDLVHHFPAPAVAQMASVVAEFAREQWDTLRVAPGNSSPTDVAARGGQPH